LALLLLASIDSWGGLIVLFPKQHQDFPLWDDWAYSRSAILFASGQGVRYFPYFSAMPQLGQWLWAWPFLRWFAPPLFALRLSTLVLGWLGIAAFHDLLCQEGLPPMRAAVIAAALAFTPLFFVLQGSFMTDVPALSFQLIALAFYRRAALGNRLHFLLAAAVFATLGAITRQTAIVAPLVALVMMTRTARLRLDPAWIAAVTLPLAAGIVAHLWLHERSDVIHATLMPQVPDLLDVISRLFSCLHWCGLIALPVFLGWGARPSWQRFVVTLALLCLAAGWLYYRYAGLPTGPLFPYVPGVITVHGAYTYIVRGNIPIIIPLPLRWTLTVAGIIGAGLLIDRLLDWFRWRERGGLIMGLTAVHLPLILIAPDLYDRYILSLFPGALWLAGWQAPPQANRPRGLVALALLGTAAVCLLATSAICAVGLMHDCFSWNQARWSLGRQALDQTIRPWEIEGGFTWDGWYSLEAPPSASPIRGGLTMFYTRQRFPHVTGRYALAFSALPAGVIQASQPYRLWFAPGDHSFYFIESVQRADKPGQ
jgi:hypothetical protein